MKLPKVSGKEILNILLKRGFIVRRQKGSHVTLYRKNDAAKGLYVTVPIHGNKELLPKTLLSILRQAEMSKEDLN